MEFFQSSRACTVEATLLIQRGEERWPTTHLSHVQQVNLQKETQSASSNLVRRSADGIAQLAADGQPVPPFMLWKKGIKKKVVRFISSP